MLSLPSPTFAIWAKLEGRNPAGSVKDRVALSLVEAAERDGRLVPGRAGQTLIEPSSGNTGIALALVCRLRGYHLKVVLPTNVSPERRQLLEVFGAEIIDSPGNEGSNGAVRLAQALQPPIPSGSSSTSTRTPRTRSRTITRPAPRSSPTSPRSRTSSRASAPRARSWVSVATSRKSARGAGLGR